MNATHPTEAPLSVYEMVFPDKTNHYSTLFGGQVMQLMDKAAFIVATRRARRHVVTVASDNVSFKAPVKVGHLVEVRATLTKVGRTSMQVFTELFSEDTLSEDRTLCASGSFTLVALNHGGKPVAVSPATTAVGGQA
ncbi:acyl-CoA thioesterase [Acanthopleuribacter pedis]|uniref:Acyl-CoA thioesterase n=1 Tax=Acanthopleuribacter pedis TaxID=442870 RepID=A0A8J7QBR1_9BACT|nr:acyl-CoA thioesterase [Acanthopleuribacter pedis]MBO1320779.1 acyl-CoA thioesterase [Acanthopleuribacter pedis]